MTIKKRTTNNQDDPRLVRFDAIKVGGEFYHGATRFVKQSMSSALTTVTRRLQRFTPSTRVRRVVATSNERTARQLASDAYQSFVTACDRLHV